MHDDRARTEARVQDRPGDARSAPGFGPSAKPCEVSAFAVRRPGGGAGGVGRRRTCPSSRGRPGGRRGRRPGSGFSGKVPAEWAGRRVEAVVDLGFNDRGPGFQAEGLAFGADGVPDQSGRSPAITGSLSAPKLVRGEAGRVSSRRWRCPASWAGAPMTGSGDRLGDLATAGTRPAVRARGRRPGRGRRGGALALVLDVEVLLGVMEPD